MIHHQPLSGYLDGLAAWREGFHQRRAVSLKWGPVSEVSCTEMEREGGQKERKAFKGAL